MLVEGKRESVSVVPQIGGVGTDGGLTVGGEERLRGGSAARRIGVEETRMPCSSEDLFGGRWAVAGGGRRWCPGAAVLGVVDAVGGVGEADMVSSVDTWISRTRSGREGKDVVVGRAVVAELSHEACGCCEGAWGFRSEPGASDGEARRARRCCLRR